MVCFQEVVIQAVGSDGLEALKGLIFGTDGTSCQEEEPTLLSFGHVSQQEFAAAEFIAVQEKVCLLFCVCVHWSVCFDKGHMPSIPEMAITLEMVSNTKE